MSSIISKITMYPLTTGQYIRESHPDKRQIYIHHTAGNPNPFAAIDDWNHTPERVGTAFVIGGTQTSPTSKWTDGKILQAFNSQYWASHLGLKAAHLKAGGPGAKSQMWLHTKSIGIEICNWGGLTLKDGKFLNWAKKPVPEDEVLEYEKPYKGYRYYQKYTDAQLDSTWELLVYLCDKYDIETKFKGTGMFQVTPAALRGENGIWTHTSVRPDKSDCHPQKELIEMLSAL